MDDARREPAEQEGRQLSGRKPAQGRTGTSPPWTLSHGWDEALRRGTRAVSPLLGVFTKEDSPACWQRRL